MTVPASGAGEETAAAASELVTLCREAGLTLATAESLTAGLLAGTVADVPGASNVLRGGLVVYATDLKHSLAGVDAALLDRQGPVDPTVAGQLARGAAQRCGADIGVGVTGVAGPDSQDGHPVGEVWLGVWCRDLDGGEPRVTALDDGWRARVDAGSGVRDAIRRHTVHRALDQVCAVIPDLAADPL